ncbi:unnamed protein product [Moneuplotes crassus]|uniref:Uncharacterized protein n=1 Tax=Euplotes crassus TaxID=5936 RepID=A0AAD2D5S2_EUPCR|nr:unnamed protein product [Moneuplotes crassus]
MSISQVKIKCKDSLQLKIEATPPKLPSITNANVGSLERSLNSISPCGMFAPSSTKNIRYFKGKKMISQISDLKYKNKMKLKNIMSEEEDRNLNIFNVSALKLGYPHKKDISFLLEDCTLTVSPKILDNIQETPLRRINPSGRTTDCRNKIAKTKSPKRRVLDRKKLNKSVHDKPQAKFNLVGLKVKCNQQFQTPKVPNADLEHKTVEDKRQFQDQNLNLLAKDSLDASNSEDKYDDEQFEDENLKSLETEEHSESKLSPKIHKKVQIPNTKRVRKKLNLIDPKSIKKVDNAKNLTKVLGSDSKNKKKDAETSTEISKVMFGSPYRNPSIRDSSTLAYISKIKENPLQEDISEASPNPQESAIFSLQSRSQEFNKNDSKDKKKGVNGSTSKREIIMSKMLKNSEEPRYKSDDESEYSSDTYESASMKSRSHAMRVEVSKKKKKKQGQVQKRSLRSRSQNHKSSNIPTEDFKSIEFDPMPNLKSKFSNRKNSVDVAKLLSKNRLKNKAHLRYQATNKMNSLRKLKLKNKNKIIYQKFLPVNQPNSSILYDNSKLPSIENERNLSNFER